MYIEQISGLKQPKTLTQNTYEKFPIYYIRQIIAHIRQKMQRKTSKKFPIHYIRQIIAQISQ